MGNAAHTSCTRIRLENGRVRIVVPPAPKFMWSTPKRNRANAIPTAGRYRVPPIFPFAPLQGKPKVAQRKKLDVEYQRFFDGVDIWNTRRLALFLPAKSGSPPVCAIPRKPPRPVARTVSEIRPANGALRSKRFPRPTLRETGRNTRIRWPSSTTVRSIQTRGIRSSAEKTGSLGKFRSPSASGQWRTAKLSSGCE